MNIDMFPESYQDDIKKATNLLKKEGCKGIFRAYLIFCVNARVSLERDPFLSKLNGELV